MRCGGVLDPEGTALLTCGDGGGAPSLRTGRFCCHVDLVNPTTGKLLDVQAGLSGSAFWLLAVVILWPATCRAFLGSPGEPFVIIRSCEHSALGFGIV